MTKFQKGDTYTIQEINQIKNKLYVVAFNKSNGDLKAYRKRQQKIQEKLFIAL